MNEFQITVKFISCSVDLASTLLATMEDAYEDNYHQVIDIVTESEPDLPDPLQEIDAPIFAPPHNIRQSTTTSAP